MANFITAVEMTLANEGGFSDHPNDAGGQTRFGITEKVAKEWGYKGEMKELPLGIAKAIYKEKYWDKLNLDKINHQIIAEISFDMGVNMGIGTAGKYLQTAYNFTTKENLKVDGVIGSKTLNVINSVKDKRTIEFITLGLITVAGKHYIELCEKNEAYEVFLLGWLRRVQKYKERLV